MWSKWGGPICRMPCLSHWEKKWLLMRRLCGEASGESNSLLAEAHKINMGGTAVGTGLNAEPQYIREVAAELSQVTGSGFFTAANLVDATNNTDIFADVSAALK